MNNIQRTFLVSPNIEHWLQKHKSTEHKTEQFYLNKETPYYYRKDFPDTYMKVTVDKHGHEEKLFMNEEMYEAQRKKHVGRVLVKKTYTMAIGEATFVLEKYLKKLKGLYILLGHFEDEKVVKSPQSIQLFQSLEPYVIKEIDQDEKYSAHTLALGSKPMEYNLQGFFEKIDAFESPNLFFWQVPPQLYVRDGVSLVLYRNIRLLNYYKMSFQKRQFASTLHRLRVLLHRTTTMLETFWDLFTPEIQHYCVELLKRYYEETKVLRYLYFLDELCATREEAKLTLYTELKSLISQEEQSVTGMLASNPFMHMMNSLTKEIKIPENQKYISLRKEVKRLLRGQLSHLEMLLAKTSEGYDDVALEALYMAINSLQTLMEDFFHVVGEKELKLIIEELNILLKPLREYRNCKERALILSNIKAESQTKTLDTDPLLCEHEAELKEKIDRALKLLRTSRFYI